MCNTEYFGFHILDEVLECVAGWKEGSSSYLIGRTKPLQRYHSSSSNLNSVSTRDQNNFFQKGSISHARSKNIQSNIHHTRQDSKYQCFRYEMHMENGHIVTKMSQSNKGSCEGLWSAVEGDRTYTLRKGMLI